MTLVEFARTLVFNYSTQEILDRLVASVIGVLGVTGAGVVLRGSDEQMHFVAASDDVILRIEHLQIELGEGPCMSAFEDDEPVLISDLRHDERFSRFSPRAADAGMAAVYTFPLRGEGKCMGALDLYVDVPRELGPHHRVAAQILADVASVYITNARSRAETQRSEDQLRHRLLHDPLTGLPNRMLLDDRLAQAVANSSRSGASSGVLFLDLDRFKAVNDTYGHHTGDLLLVAVADRLRRTLRPGDTLARLAGDEFVVICENLEAIEQAEEVAARIIEAFTAPFRVGSHLITIGVSVGVAPASGESSRTSEPLLHADAAMYDAKQKGGGRFQSVDDRLHTATNRRHGVERDLRAAIESNKLRLDFQPVVAAGTGRWESVEALLRWDHAQVGPVSPETIVAAAERTGQTLALSTWVTRAACRQMRHWMDTEHARPESIAINVSPAELLDPCTTRWWRRRCARWQLPPEALCLEITETVLVSDVGSALERPQRAARDRRQVRAGRLRHRLLVAEPPQALPGRASSRSTARSSASLANDPVDAAIVAAVAELSHTLGRTVVAEGVETSDQRKQLTRARLRQPPGLSVLAPALDGRHPAGPRVVHGPRGLRPATA